MKRSIIIAMAIAVLAVNAGCKGKEKKDAKTEEVPHSEEHENTNMVMLSEEQLKSINIAIGSIEDKQLTASLKANGILQVPNQNKASISPVYSGVIKSILVQPGNPVRKGQVIATISNPDFIRAQSTYLEVSAKIGLAELELKRQQELNAGNAGSLKNLQAAETELRTLRTSKSTLEQQLHLMGINPNSISNGKLVSVLSVTSPINGVVSNVLVKMGSYVDLTTSVAEIVDNSQLHLDLFVYEKDLPKVKNNQLIHFTLTNNPGKEYDALVYSLGSSFEGESKAVSVHAKVQGDKTGLIDGMNITAAISLNKVTVPAVPSDAIVTYAGQDYIFIQTEKKPEENKNKQDVKQGKDAHEEKGTWFERVPVAKGTTDVGYTEITLLKEVSKDAKVVVKGAFFVLAKMTNAGGHDD